MRGATFLDDGMLWCETGDMKFYSQNLHLTRHTAPERMA